MRSIGPEAGQSVALSDPLTGKQAGEEAKAAVTKVRVNNSLRRAAARRQRGREVVEPVDPRRDTEVRHNLYSVIPSPIDNSVWGASENTPGYIWYDAVSRMLSPYVANPLNLNPLRDILAEQIDFERLRTEVATAPGPAPPRPRSPRTY